MLRLQRNKKIVNRNRIIGCVLVLLIVLFAGVYYSGKASYAYWIEEEEGKKYLLPDGQLAIGFADIEEQRYYFDTDGHLVTGKFYVEAEDAYYYSDESGVLQYGAIQTEYDFFITDENGKLLTGFAENDGKRYFFNEIAQMVVGWFRHDNNWYYADGNGVIQTGFVTVDGYRYYMTQDGTRVQDAVLEIDGITYVFNQDGSVDENATLTYPIFQYINDLRIQNGQSALMLNNKVQACALLRASGLVNGFSLENTGDLESLLANRGVRCLGGYEFAYGGIEGYDFQRLMTDMQKDYNMTKALADTKVSEIGIGVHKVNEIMYYSIIFIMSDVSVGDNE